MPHPVLSTHTHTPTHTHTHTLARRIHSSSVGATVRHVTFSIGYEIEQIKVKFSFSHFHSVVLIFSFGYCHPIVLKRFFLLLLSHCA